MYVRRAERADVPMLAPLFDAYRQFYGRAADRDAAGSFLRDRIGSDESVIFLAQEDSEPAGVLGFVQLYPVFSSVSGCRSWILNDLYVLPEARRRGVARALMAAAKDLARRTNADGLSLETAVDNAAAQALYESLGYRRDDAFHRYFLDVRDEQGSDGS